ncbi:MAG: S8 family serine peptidase [Chthoniobacteraceae bacterium]
MNRSRIWVFLLFGPGTLASLQAGALKESYVLQERGIKREYVVATDEIQTRRKVRKIQEQTNPEAARSAAKAVPEGDLILYPKGEPRDDSTRRLLTRKIAVKLKPGANARAVAAGAGARSTGKVRGKWVVMEAVGEPGAALEAADKLKRAPGVEAVEVQLARQQEKRFVPNDPFFFQQWHLQNIGQNRGTPGVDVNITDVWNTYRGSGVRLAIVDDGLERTHPDLQLNYDEEDSFDFNDGDPDPKPAPFDFDDHGTSCAGVAAASGNNGLGVCGAAFEAKVAGLRLIAAPTDDEDEADAFDFHNDTIDIKSNSWGPTDNGRTLEGPGPLTIAAIQEAVATGRGGHGSLIFWAGGNGRRWKDDSNYDGYANMRETIAIGAITNEGAQASYSESGANLVAVAPSDGGTLRITTVDRRGADGYNNGRRSNDLPDADYTDTFGGTSAATPLAAGVAALMIEANPDLGWRDVQEILIRTSTRIDPTDPDWITNGGGFHFNHRYGAGLINAAAAVALAEIWKNLGPPVSAMREQVVPGEIIPDKKKKSPVQHVFHFNESELRVEHAVVTVDIRHRSRGQLLIELISPAGTTSVLAPGRPKDRGDDFQEWSFMSTHHWGEMAEGDWKVRIFDKKNGATGTLNRVQVELFGSTPVHPVVAEGAILQSDPNGNGSYETGEAVTVDFTIRSASDDALTDVRGELVESNGVSQPGPPRQFGPLAPGATATQSFSFLVSAATGSDVMARLNLSDGGTDLGEAVFTLPVGILGSATFNSNSPGPVAVPKGGTSGKASAYPTSILVNSLPPDARIRNVKVHLNGVTHPRSHDFDVLLAKRGSGRKVLLLSDAGNANLVGVDFVFDDNANPIPGAGPIPSGTYRPTNSGKTIDKFPRPAPPKPFDGFLAAFRSTTANDIWDLFVRDDKPAKSGQFANWSLEIEYAH